MKTKQRNEFVISFRVNSEERNELLELASKSGMSISELMREKLDLRTTDVEQIPANRMN